MDDPQCSKTGLLGGEDGSLRQEAAEAPHVVMQATPALPGRVYTPWHVCGKSALYRVFKVRVYTI